MGVFPTWGHLAKNGFLGPERYLEFKGDWACVRSLKGTTTSSLDYVCLSSSATDLCSVHLESLACHTLQHDTNPDPPLCLILSPHSKGPLSRSQVQSLSFSSRMAIPVVPSRSFRDQRWGVIFWRYFLWLLECFWQAENHLEGSRHHARLSQGWMSRDGGEMVLTTGGLFHISTHVFLTMTVWSRCYHDSSSTRDGWDHCCHPSTLKAEQICFATIHTATPEKLWSQGGQGGQQRPALFLLSHSTPGESRPTVRRECNPLSFSLLLFPLQARWFPCQTSLRPASEPGQLLWKPFALDLGGS